MDVAHMTKEQIAERLKVVQTELDKYYVADQTQDAEEEIKVMSPRAYDTLVTELNRLTRALA